jgi:hypothetical protein
MQSHSTVRIVCAVIACCGGALAQSGRVDNAAEIAALRQAVQQLQSEVKGLRYELAKLELQRHRDAMRQITSDLEFLHATQARLEEENRTRERDLTDVQDLLNTNLDAAGQTDLQTAVVDLAVTQTRRIEEEMQKARAREHELLARKQTEEQAVNRLERLLEPSGGTTNEDPSNHF